MSTNVFEFPVIFYYLLYMHPNYGDNPHCTTQDDFNEDQWVKKLDG